MASASLRATSTTRGGEELITAPGPGGGPHIKVLGWDGSSFLVIDEFFAYAAGFTGGVYVAAGSIESAGNGGAEIITGPGAGGGPQVRIFSDLNGNGRVSDDATFDEFFAYGAFYGGVRVAAGDTDNSGSLVEVVTAAGPGGSPHVRIFDDNGDAGTLLSDNPTDDEFFAFDPAWSGGVFVAVGIFRRAAFTFVANPTNIPDNGTVAFYMCLPPGAGIVRDLDVGLGISHSFNADLDVALSHVSTGTGLSLFTDIGNDDDGLLIRLSDEAGVDIAAAPDSPSDAAVVGTFRPEAPAALSAFDGEDASGCWRLTVIDDAAADTGVLFDWTLYIAF